MKTILISIHPEHCYNIFGTELKTIELRLRMTEPPFKAVVYCTQPKSHYRVGCFVGHTDELYRMPDGELKYGDSVELMAFASNMCSADNYLNGKVIGEFICNKITPIIKNSFINPFAINEELIQKSCISNEHLIRYSDGYKKDVNGLHITAPKLYDKPKELGEFKSKQKLYLYGNKDYPFGNDYLPIARPPQSYMRIQDPEEEV